MNTIQRFNSCDIKKVNSFSINYFQRKDQWHLLVRFRYIWTITTLLFSFCNFANKSVTVVQLWVTNEQSTSQPRKWCSCFIIFVELRPKRSQKKGVSTIPDVYLKFKTVPPYIKPRFGARIRIKLIRIGRSLSLT